MNSAGFEEGQSSKWRGWFVGGLTGLAKTAMLTGLVAVCLLVAGCSHYRRVYVRVEDARSWEPLDSAKITAGLYDPVNPDLRRTRVTEVFTRSDGNAMVRIPICRTPEPHSGSYWDDFWAWCSDLNNIVGPEAIVEKPGYQTKIIYESNGYWSCMGKDSSEPLPIRLYPLPNPTNQVSTGTSSRN